MLDGGDALRIAAVLLWPIVDWRVSIHAKRNGVTVPHSFGRVVSYAVFVCAMAENGISRHLHSASAKDVVFAAIYIPVIIVVSLAYYYRWRSSKYNSADTSR